MMEGLELSLIVPLFVISGLLHLFALISCIKAEETNGPKWLWVLIILFVSLFGPILYFVLGRKQQ